VLSSCGAKGACALTQARLSFTHIGGPEPSGRRAGMDAGDADGADALLSLAKLANAAESSGMLDDDFHPQQDTHMEQIDTPSIATRPRRNAKPPPKADVSPTIMIVAPSLLSQASGDLAWW